MTKFNPSQKLLFPPEYLLACDPLEKYEILFSNLNPKEFLEDIPGKIGRPQVSRQALLKALIYKNLKGLVHLSDLVADLSDQPNMAFKCGLDPLKSVPSVERFSSFLRDTPNEILQATRKSLVFQLIELGEIKGKYLAIDSLPIKAKVKENNLKTAIKDRFIKGKVPRGDPDSRL
jgi:transposase